MLGAKGLKCNHSHTKRDRAVSNFSLQYVEKHRVVGLERHRNLKNGGI